MGKSWPLLLLFFSFYGKAEVLKFKPAFIPATPKDEIVLNGFAGNLSFQGREGLDSYEMRVQQNNPASAPSQARNLFDQWIFSYKREGNKVLIHIRGPQSKEDWEKLRALKADAGPEYNIEIIGPSAPLEVSWRQGEVTVLDWQKDVYIVSQKSSFRSKNTKGELRVNVARGSVEVVDHEGTADIESFSGDVEIKSLKGLIQLENFYGASKIQNLDGSLKLSSYKGATRVIKSKGQIDFKNGLSPFIVENFEGDFRGNTEQGPVTATLTGKTNVRIKGKSSPINIRVPNSGAWVNIGSHKGSLNAPNYLRVNRYTNIKTVTGQLRGRQNGRIFVRTENGPIRVH